MRKIFYILIALFIGSCAIEDTQQIDYYIADTTLKIWSEKFNSGIKGVSNDTIILGVDSLLTWSKKINTYIFAKTQNSSDTIIYGSDNFEAWRTKFNYVANDTNLYNINAITYFNREYEMSVSYKLFISNTFDSLDLVLNKIKLLYVFFGYSDSSVMHSWVSDHAISYPENQKPHFFKNSGIEGVNYGNFVDMAYANSNFNLVEEGVDGDSMVYGIRLNDRFKWNSNINNTQIGAADGANKAVFQIGRTAVSGGIPYIRFTNFHATGVISIITPTDIQNSFHFKRIADTVKVYENNDKIYDNTNTFLDTPNQDIFLTNYNSGGSPIYEANQSTIGYFYIADLLSEEDINVINNAFDYYFSQLTPEDQIFETDELYYKVNRDVEVNNPCILYQEGLRKLLATNDTLYFTYDGGSSYTKYAFPSTQKIASAYVWNDNTISLFHKDLNAYYSDDSLQTLNSSDILEEDGTAYTFHTPANSSFPGNYFNVLNRIKSDTVDGREIAFLPAYVNVSGGAAPVILWMSIDKGVSWRVGYEFGQNPNYRDDGTTDGGTTGTLLGDPANPIVVAHIHDVVVGVEDSVIFCTGDNIAESKWFRSYFINDSTLSTDSIASYYLAGRYKTGGLHWENDSLTFGSDDNLVGTDLGVFRTDYANIAIPGNHRKLASVGTTWNMFERDSIIIHSAFNGVLSYSKDDGNTWQTGIILPELNINGSMFVYSLLTPPDNNGWYSFSDNARFINYNNIGGTILIKIK
jgi:hypothetical protein